MLSAFTGVAPYTGVAMTGEITLTGRLLPVGGIKEKTLAAHRNKLHTVLLPDGNREDTEELPSEVTGEVEFRFADTVIRAMQQLFPSELFEIRPF
jgi:ATP-dependent Lon protease